MKKTFLLFLFLPLLVLSQNNLVKWYNGNLSPTILESHVAALNIKGNGNEIENLVWAPDNIMYSYKAPSYSSNLSLANYVQFAVTPETGYKIENAVFQFNVRVNSGNALMQVKYSTNENFSASTTLKEEVKISNTYSTFNLDIPTVISKGQTLYIRVYVYSANDALHIKHDVLGNIAPTLTGLVSLENPVKPVPREDKVAVLKNKTTTINVLSNDEYIYSGALKKITVTEPSNGKVMVNGVRDVTYTPDSDFVGYDHFYYTLTNSAGESTQAKVEVQTVDPGIANTTPLVRWNKSNFQSTNYNNDVIGFPLKTAKQSLSLIGYGSSTNNGSSFMLSNLPKPFWEGNTSGTLDPSSYLQISVQSGADKMMYLNSFNMKFTGVGNGNMTIKYSKTPDFSGDVLVFENVNNVAYTSAWSEVVAKFKDGTVLFPNEVMYIRVYTYNTNNNVIIDFLQAKEVGPEIFGFAAPYVPEPLPCQTIVTWTGDSWKGGLPTLNKKAVINANYDTAKNGNFSSCNLTVKSGNLTIASKNSITVSNEIVVNPDAFIEVQNDANLIQNNDAAVNSGNITVLRDIKIGAARTQYNYLGSPVTFAQGQNLKTIYLGISFALYYNEANNLFGTSSGANVPGRGLAVKEPTTKAVSAGNAIVTAKYIGIPQNGVIPFLLANSNVGNNTSLGYNLLGNPYPSNIDLTKLYELNVGNRQPGKGNIDATFYLWDNEVNNDIALSQQGSDYQGQAYAIFNVLAGKKGTGTSAAGFLNSNIIVKKTPVSVIKVGQGFMTKALVKNYTLTFNNSIRTDAQAETNFLGRQKNNDVEDDRFWLKLISPSNLTSTLAVVYFEKGNNEFGAEDSESKLGSDNIFSVIEDKKVAINGKNTFTSLDIVALGTSHYEDGVYTIAAAEREGIFADTQSIYLKDKQTGIITNLSQGAYTFNAEKGDSINRFEIIYQPDTVLVTDNKVKDGLVVYKDANNFVITSSSDKITDVEVYDAVGRLVYKIKPNNNTAQIASDHLSAGIYVLKISQGNQITSKKVIK